MDVRRGACLAGGCVISAPRIERSTVDRLPAPGKPPRRSRVRTRPQTTPRTKPVVAAPWRKSAPVTLTPNASISDVLHTVITSCRDHWDANLAAAIAGDHPEGIHQFRVGLRRFRSALSLLRAYIPDDQATWLKAEAKALGTAMGQVRDLDVFLADLIAPVAAGAGSDPQVAVMLRTAREARSAAHARAAENLRTRQYRRFMARLNAWLDGRGWETGEIEQAENAAELARRILNRRMAKISKRTRGLARATPAEIHALRIQIKKLRYGLEFFQSVLPDRRAARLGRLLKSLQDTLGHLNDLDVAGRTLNTLAGEARDADTKVALAHAGTAVASTFRPRVKAALPEAVRLAQRLRASKPFA
jgi:CHAD domain-containing protein